jgi:hypothetical protein
VAAAAAAAAAVQNWRGLSCDARGWSVGGSDGVPDGGGGGPGASLCSERRSGCSLCGRLLPTLFFIGSIKTGTTLALGPRG